MQEQYSQYLIEISELQNQMLLVGFIIGSSAFVFSALISFLFLWVKPNALEHEEKICLSVVAILSSSLLTIMSTLPVSALEMYKRNEIDQKYAESITWYGIQRNNHVVIDNNGDE
jgi:hypothetical protein